MELPAMVGWIGVDLDGTLATYTGWVNHTHIGAPVPSMVTRVKKWLEDGLEVRVFTARVYPLLLVYPQDMLRYCFRMPYHDDGKTAEEAVHVIQSWCAQHLGAMLPITCMKDYGMIELWDDRAVQVIPNTGMRASPLPEPGKETP